MKKAVSGSDNYEPLPEYDLTKLGPGVVGKYAHRVKPISPEQIHEEARLVARREIARQMAELRSEDKRLRQELASMKKQLDRLEKARSGGVAVKVVKRPRQVLGKKSA